MSKRKPVFLGVEERVVHGQVVEAAIYGEIDPDPTCDFDALLADVCGASPEKLSKIKTRVQRYKDQVFDAAHPELSEFDFSEANLDDDFLDTAAENAQTELDTYKEDHKEKFIPLDKALEELGVK